MKRSMILLLLTSLVMAGEPLTPLDVAKLKKVGDAVISPDGRYVAYTLKVQRTLFEDEDGPAYTHLYVWDAERGSRPFVTSPSGVSGIRWTPDGKAISFLAMRGDDLYESLYKIPVDGGEAQQVLSHFSDILHYDWSPDGKRIVFSAPPPLDLDNEDLKDQGFTQEVYEEDIETNHLWIANASGEGEPEEIEIDGWVEDFTWGKSHIAVVVSPSSLVDVIYMRSDIALINGDTKKQDAFIDMPGKLGVLAWSPDGKRLAMRGGADIHDPNDSRLYLADMASPEKPKMYFEKDEGDVRQFTWKDDNTLVYLWDEALFTGVRELNVTSGKSKTLIAADAKAPAFSEVGMAAGSTIFVASTATHPDELFLMKKGEKAPARLTDSNPWLKDRALAKQEPITYQARDGLALHGVLVHPLNAEKGKRYPTILTIHGGPESHFRNEWITSYSEPGQVAAGRGYAVFYPNYRASTGRGVAFSKLDHGRPAMEEFNDIVDAITHLTKMGLTDKKRVGVTGSSYGGYATAWCSTALSEHFAAGVMFVGISNKISKAGVSDIPEEVYLVHDRKHIWEDWDLFMKQSPIYHVEKAKTPLLILHGKKDTRVPPGQGLELYRHLKTLGKTPVRLVYYPDEKHGNRKMAARYDYHLRMLRWFRTWLEEGDRKMPQYTVPYRPEETEKSD